MKRLFIFDVDGVLLDLWPAMRSVFACYYNMSLSDKDWDDIIDDFLHNPQPYLEFGEYFSQSQTFKNLLPVKGMPELVFSLSNHCFDLAIVSSADPAYIEQRRQNIKEHYADCFEKIICVGMKQTKEEALRQVASGYDEVFFVDDNPGICLRVSVLLPARFGLKTNIICFYGRALTIPASKRPEMPKIFLISH